MKSLFDNFVSTCSTVQPYVLAVELDALRHSISKPVLLTGPSASTPPASLLKTPIELLPLLQLQFAEVLVAWTISGDE